MIEIGGDEFLAALDEGGQLVWTDLKRILLDQSLDLSPSLHAALASEFASYSPALLNQLGLMHDRLIFKTNGRQDSQFSYEINMVKTLLTRAKEVQTLLQADEELIVDLVFAILVSDIGKTGPEVAKKGQFKSVICRIFNQAIFSNRHKEWLMKAKPETFPPEINRLVMQMPDDDTNSAFKGGFFQSLPISVYLYVIKQVALELAGENQTLVAQAEQLFTISKQEKEFLLKLGIDPDVEQIGPFFTKSHVLFGEDFLSQTGMLNDRQQQFVPIALSHHLSQGILPVSIAGVENLLAHPSMLRQIIFLEILDKVDAFHSRFKDKPLEEARANTWDFINSKLQFNYRQYPDLIKLYQAVFQEMTNL